MPNGRQKQRKLKKRKKKLKIQKQDILDSNLTAHTVAVLPVVVVLIKRGYT